MCSGGGRFQGFGVVPRQPFSRSLHHLGGVFLQGRYILDWIDPGQAAGVDQAHEQITGPSAVFGLVEQGIFAEHCLSKRLNLSERYSQSPLFRVKPEKTHKRANENAAMFSLALYRGAGPGYKGISGKNGVLMSGGQTP